MIAGLGRCQLRRYFHRWKTGQWSGTKDRDVAMVFQSYGLYPNMNVYENIRFPLKVRKIDQSSHDKRVRRASAMVELDEFLHRKPAELSGGQRQRVALAEQLCVSLIFLMDEPLVQSDANCAYQRGHRLNICSMNLKSQRYMSPMIRSSHDLGRSCCRDGQRAYPANRDAN